MSAQKSEQADLVVTAVERFAQLIPLNIQEIFTWYFEQKGVENPERFLDAGAGVNGVNNNLTVAGVNNNLAGVVENNNPESDPQLLPVQPENTEEANSGNGFGSEQILCLLNKVMDKLGNKEKNPLEMLVQLKKSRKTRKEK